MNLAESLIDGLVDIKHHAFRTIMQALGIVLGVTSVVATVSILDSINIRTVKMYERLGSLKQVVIGRDWRASLTLKAVQKAATPLDLEDAENLTRLTDYVDSVEPLVGRMMRIKQGRFDEDQYVESSGPAMLERNNLELHSGRTFTAFDLESNARVTMLGASIAKAAFGSADPLGQTVFLSGKGFTVVGLLAESSMETGGNHRNMLEWMNWRMFVPITTMTRVLLNTREVQNIKVQLKDITQFEVAKKEIDAVLRRRRNGEANYRIYSAKERMETSQKEMMALNITFSVVGAISLIVGGVVIMNILLAAFHERVREVGIRKALGATWLDIIAQFIVESVLITVIGGAIGIVFGIGAVKIIASVTEDEFWVSPSSMLVAFTFSVVVGIVFGFYPAVKASRLNPIEALRYE